MKARVVTVRLDPAKVDEAIGIFRDSVAPAAQEYKGCHAIFLATDRSSGKAISISIWDDQELQSSEASGYLQEQFAKFAGILTAPPIREVYDVGNWERSRAEPSHARIVTTQLKPGLASQAPARYRDALLPLMRQQPGFLGALQLVDTVAGKIFSATVWASESDMLAGQAKGGYLDRMREVLRPEENQVAPALIENYAVSARWVRQS
jgi:quinol monooxygenase YgiN